MSGVAGQDAVREGPGSRPLPAQVVRLGSPEPFEAFYTRELVGLVALARALCGPALADDVAQDAMLAAYRRWDEVRELDIPAAWVRRVALNMATSVLRRRAVEARALLRLGARRTAYATIEPQNEAFWSAVRKLPRRQAQAVALHYVDDLSVVDIAATLECSEGAVKQHLFRARQALARDFGGWADGDETDLSDHGTEVQP